MGIEIDRERFDDADYTRFTERLEQCLAALESGVRGLAFASGLAAEDCLIRTVCSPGDHVLACSS